MTMERHLSAYKLSFLLLFFAFAPVLPAQTLQVTDAQGHSVAVTAAQIASMPHVAVNVSDHDKAAAFEGVPLATVLSKSGIQLGGHVAWTAYGRGAAGSGSRRL